MRWPSRRGAARWGAIALEAVAGGGFLATAATDGGIGPYTMFAPSVFLPLVVALTLATRPAARWFSL